MINNSCVKIMYFIINYSTTLIQIIISSTSYAKGIFLHDSSVSKKKKIKTV